LNNGNDILGKPGDERQGGRRMKTQKLATLMFGFCLLVACAGTKEAKFDGPQNLPNWMLTT
jgi:hypothetical protein